MQTECILAFLACTIAAILEATAQQIHQFHCWNRVVLPSFCRTLEGRNRTSFHAPLFLPYSGTFHTHKTSCCSDSLPASHCITKCNIFILACCTWVAALAGACYSQHTLPTSEAQLRLVNAICFSILSKFACSRGLEFQFQCFNFNLDYFSLLFLL